MEKLDLENLTSEERKELLKSKSNRNSNSKMGTIYPRRIREILASTNLNEQTFKEYEAPIVIRVPQLPKTCPNCHKSSKHFLHIKFIKLRNKCFDCVIKDEQKLRLNGDWKKYEEWKVKENQLSYFKDTKDEVEDYLRNGLKVEQQYVKENGSIEKWKNPNYQRDKIFIEDKLKELVKFIKKLEKEIIKLRKKFN